MKHAVLCILAILCAGIAHADYTTMAVRKVEGETTVFILGEMPKLTFDESNIIIETLDGSTIIPLNEIKEYSFETFPSSGIKTIGTNKELPFTYNGNSISFEKLEGLDNHVDIFRLDGTKILSAKLNENTTTTIDCSAWPQSVYIISIKGMSYKMIKL